MSTTRKRSRPGLRFPLESANGRRGKQSRFLEHDRIRLGNCSVLSAVANSTCITVGFPDLTRRASLVPRSLRQSMRNRRPTPTTGPKESTVQIDVEEMSMDVDGVSLRVYDCAGQVAYLCCKW